VSTSYEIAHMASIPSDDSPHKVTVGIVDLSPSLTYVTVPKVVPHAFLQAKVVNSSQFTFLPGKTNIFLDNSFVAKAELSAVAPQEEFDCSLGVDPGVRVTYKPLVKVAATAGVLSKSKVVTHTQAIQVKNVHSYPVTVSVKDHLPQSSDEKIKVNLQVPQIDPKHPERCKEAKLTADGTLVWELSLQPQTQKDLELRYTVEHPASQTLDYRNN